MGSHLALSVAGVGPSDADASWILALATFREVERALSRFDPGSALSRLNAASGSGRWFGVVPVLRTALVLADRARRATDGAFDARIIRALEAVGEHGGVALGSDRAGPWLELRRDGALRLAAPADLGGIGKGLALRLAAARIAPIAGDVLLDAGGDLLGLGTGPDGRPWLVAIEDPADPGFPSVLLRLHGALATSSTAVRRWTGPDGRAAHHLIEPLTGQPYANGLVSVSVMAPDPAWAEVLTKWLFGAGAAGIAARAASRGVVAWWVDSEGRIGRSPEAVRHELHPLKDGPSPPRAGPG